MKPEKEKRRWGLILFIILIIIGTSAGVIYSGFSPENYTFKYNGIKFVKYPDRWEAKINGAIAAFSFLPTEVSYINMAGDTLPKLQNKYEIDVTYDYNSTYKESIALAQHQIALTLGQYNIYVRKGFTTNSSFNLPVISCNESTSSAPVLYFRGGNETYIKSDGSCIIVQGASNNDFIKAKDRIMYGLLGVLNG